MLDEGIRSAGRQGELAADTRRQVSRVLAILREELGMQLAYLTEFVGDHQVIREVDGDADPFRLTPGVEVPLEGSYCRMVADGELDCVVPDTAREPKVARLAVTEDANLGAYVGVPVRRKDGQLYGTLCCASERPKPSLAGKETGFMNVLARIIADAVAEDESRSLLEAALVSRTDDLLTANAKLAESHQEMVRRLSMAVEFRDDDTGAHVHRVGRLARRLAEAAGLSAADCELMREAAPLHDVGKVAIPDGILLKRGPLTEAERAVMQKHAQVGHDLLAGSDCPVLQMAATIALAHHEHFDGSGYPRGLAGEDIPLVGRIVAIVDVYDALSSDRAYRPAFRPPEIRQTLMAGRGTQFDPRLLDLFMEQTLQAKTSRWVRL